ncbi:MAG: hypothetical protein EZS28_005996 [Streblomastix strix]|uniref:Uncharacterized protein n=1 Tax=Streblomastix strix TaxID=222440 RepID=A0A5J4WU92_9EUKA|nr:MAG: hypothetical protein EZS28_005996 [Streblomastix strix]
MQANLDEGVIRLLFIAVIIALLAVGSVGFIYINTCSTASSQSNGASFMNMNVQQTITYYPRSKTLTMVRSIAQRMFCMNKYKQLTYDSNSISYAYYNKGCCCKKCDDHSSKQLILHLTNGKVLPLGTIFKKDQLAPIIEAINSQEPFNLQSYELGSYNPPSTTLLNQPQVSYPLSYSYSEPKSESVSDSSALLHQQPALPQQTGYQVQNSYNTQLPE